MFSLLWNKGVIANNVFKHIVENEEAKIMGKDNVNRKKGGHMLNLFCSLESCKLHCLFRVALFLLMLKNLIYMLPSEILYARKLNSIGANILWLTHAAWNVFWIFWQIFQCNYFYFLMEGWTFVGLDKSIISHIQKS